MSLKTISLWTLKALMNAVPVCSALQNMMRVLQSSATANRDVVINGSLVWTDQEILKIMKELMKDYHNTEPGLQESRFWFI